jgi:hypothetical protein
MPPKVSVFVLCSTERTGWVNPALCLSLLNLREDPRLNISVEMVTDRKPVEHARNLCIVGARTMGADVCVQIDNDMTLPSNLADIVLDAWSTGKAVVSLPYAILPPEGPQMIPGDNSTPDGRFRQTGCAGGGVLILNSEVWRVIPRGPWFRWLVNDDEVLSRKLGEDYYFCQLVQEHGLTVWTHERVAGHLKTANATGWVLRLTRLENEQARQRGGILPIDVLNPPAFVE